MTEQATDYKARRAFRRRCVARREPRNSGLFSDRYWGRCDLNAGHAGHHKLERGMFTIRWSTEAI